MNTPHTGEHARLMALLDAYGTNLAHWPEAERPAEAALTAALGRDPALAAAFADARALDAALGDIDLPAADDLHAHRLQQRILAALPLQAGGEQSVPSTTESLRTATPTGRRTRMPGWLRPALAAMVPLVIGFGAGVSGSGSYLDVTAAPLAVAANGTATPINAPASPDTQYADETTMAPFLLAANVETMTEEMRR